MKKIIVIAGVLGTCACGPVGSGPDAIDHPLPDASDFSCSDLDGSETACIDFNDGNDATFASEGGAWDVEDGWYVGTGPEQVPGPCPDSLMTHAIWSTAQAQDLSVHVRMASVLRVDKVLVLRSQDPANRVQLNFRALSENGALGDLMVQEIRDCTFTMFTAEGQVPAPHDVGQAIDVDVDLVGTHLSVQMDGNSIFDDDVPVAVRSGRVGVAVIDHSETVFDNLIVRSHDAEAAAP